MSYKPNTYTFQPSNPVGTTSTSGVMMGLKGSFISQYSGILRVTIYGNITNTTAVDGVNFGGLMGTGTPPNNGDSPIIIGSIGIGRVKGNIIERFDGAGAYRPFRISAVVGNLGALVPGTTYWIDMTLAVITGGTASVKNLMIKILEK